MRRRLPLILCCLLVGPLVPAQAVAQNSNAAPGVSALDEYFETVPTATGGQITHGIAAAPRPDGPPSAPDVPAPAAAALKQAGGDGEAVLELTRSTARVAAPPARPDTPVAAPHVPDDSPSGLATIAGVFLGSSEAGAGIRLPLVLLLTALPLILLRLRTRSGR